MQNQLQKYSYLVPTLKKKDIAIIKWEYIQPILIGSRNYISDIKHSLACSKTKAQYYSKAKEGEGTK